MPFTIKKGEFQYKDPDSGEYKGVDAISERTTAEMLDFINESLPPDYMALADDVEDLQNNTNYNYGVPAANQYASCDDVLINSIYHITSSGGTAIIPDFPFNGDPGWLVTTMYSTTQAMQIAYPWTPSYSNLPKYRTMKFSVWGDWFSLSSYNNLGVAHSGDYASCDDVNQNGIIHITNDGSGTNTIPDFPFQYGWLETVTNGSQTLQIAYPWTPSSSATPKYRVKRTGVWTDWFYIGSPSSPITYNVTQNINRDSYSNTFNQTISPQITTDTNGWLQAVDTDTSSETGKTDMAPAIMAMLNSTGYCHLGPGIFYVSGNIDMPEGSCIEGCGNKTVVRLLSSVSSGYIVRVTQFNTIGNVTFSGGYSQPADVLDEDLEDFGARHGIYYIANGNGEETPQPSPFGCLIHDCRFVNFDGSGFYLHNSGGSTREGITVNNCYIQHCKVGINIDYFAEYCKFTNVVTYQCNIACINNGGNNTFTACTFHGVTGMLLDNSANDKRNIAHGSVVGCMFCHINNFNHPAELGGGDGVKAINHGIGMWFTGCEFGFSKVNLINSSGFTFNNCWFNGTPEIKSLDGPVFVNGCTFRGTPVIQVSGSSRITNCYMDSTGAPVTA